MLMLFFVFGGYIMLLSDKWKIQTEFAPAIICTSISSILFVCGILNVFIPSVVFISLGGLFFFWSYILKFCIKRTYRPNKRHILIIIIWGGILIYFAVLIRGAHFMAYDNFTHWAIVIREMVLCDRMPNFQDPLIMFNSYPLGSALFIYYICKIIGMSDACFMFGQIIMLISFLLPLVAFVKKKNAILGMLILLFAVFALISNISIYDLLVDTVMPLAGVSLICLMAYENKEKDENRLIFSMIPLNIFLIQVKNSGIFFILLGWLWYFLYWKRNIKTKKLLIKYVVANIIVPLFTLFLWKRHVALVFWSANTSKHAMSLENYKNNFFQKTSDNILHIGKLMLNKIFDYDSDAFQFMIVIAFIMCIIIVSQIKNYHSMKKYIGELLYLFFVYGLYLFFVFCMYIFSMPLGEASNLDSYSRYIGTIIIFIYGVAVIFILRDWKERPAWLLTVSILLVCIFPIFKLRTLCFPLIEGQRDYEASVRYSFQKLISDNEVEIGKKYIIYNDYNDDNGYLYYIARYELWSEDVFWCYYDNLEEVKDSLADYDYLIIRSEGEKIKEYLEDKALVVPPKVIIMQ